MELTRFDNDLLNIIQKEFPVTERPYQEMAARLHVSEDDVLKRVHEMKDQGLIRRIGAVFDSRTMGYYSALCACMVPQDQLESVAASINRLPGVTHNYVREHRYNIWFTLTAVSQTAVEEIIKQLEQATGIDMIVMPATTVYKIDAAFEMGGKHD